MAREETAALATTAPAAWGEDLAPIGDADWSYARARHLLDRAGFGGTPDDISRLAHMTPEAAVRSLVDYQSTDQGRLSPFEHSGVYDPTLTPFPPTRPAAGEGAVFGRAAPARPAPCRLARGAFGLRRPPCPPDNG